MINLYTLTAVWVFLSMETRPARRRGKNRVKGAFRLKVFQGSGVSVTGDRIGEKEQGKGQEGLEGRSN